MTLIGGEELTDDQQRWLAGVRRRQDGCGLSRWSASCLPAGISSRPPASLCRRVGRSASETFIAYRRCRTIGLVAHFHVRPTATAQGITPAGHSKRPARATGSRWLITPAVRLDFSSRPGPRTAVGRRGYLPSSCLGSMATPFAADRRALPCLSVMREFNERRASSVRGAGGEDAGQVAGPGEHWPVAGLDVDIVQVGGLHELG